jgi:type IV secretory pathway TraG/TraD family ATPase VirD4
MLNLICAPNGIPQRFNFNSSHSKGENWQLTAGWRQSFSHCLLFNPTDPRSARYNPLLEVRKGPDEVRDVQNIADVLVDPEGALERRSHWEKTSHSLLVGAILHILYAEEDKTLARVATNQAGQRIVERDLNVQPTIKVRPGWPLRVLIHKDLTLRPWAGDPGAPHG